MPQDVKCTAMEGDGPKGLWHSATIVLNSSYEIKRVARRMIYQSLGRTSASAT